MSPERHTTRARSRYTSIPAKISKCQLKKEEMDCTKMEAIKEICSIFSQCQLCHHHLRVLIVKRNKNVKVLQGKVMPLVLRCIMQIKSWQLETSRWMVSQKS